MNWIEEVIVYSNLNPQEKLKITRNIKWGIYVILFSFFAFLLAFSLISLLEFIVSFALPVKWEWK